MLRDWLSRWRQRHEARLLRKHAIPEALWQQTLQRYPFLARRSAADLQRLRELSALFLARKEFHGAAGFKIDDEIALAVAAQACLPVLHLGLGAYESFVGIVMHAHQVRAQREWMDEHGVVHEWEEELAGEAMEGGPLMLAWSEVDAATADEGASVYNVVLHEFAHVLDMADGVADGIPPLPGRSAREHWRQVLEAEWWRFGRRVDAGQPTVIDPYGREALEEFFAVAVEAFFVEPAAMQDEHPYLYTLMRDYFRQDPASTA